ncbi:MAG: hypothetical protein IJK02_12515, partial [Clostridia bacterium]|nr:hypothetical protein [Clostridia bacterium]
MKKETRVGALIKGQMAVLRSPIACTNNKGNTAQFAAHALLDLYSVILHRFSLPTARLTASNLYNLTKKSTAQS